MNGGVRPAEPSTVVEMLGLAPRVVRRGKGTDCPAEWFVEPEVGVDGVVAEGEVEEEGEEEEEEEEEEAEQLSKRKTTAASRRR